MRPPLPLAQFLSVRSTHVFMLAAAILLGIAPATARVAQTPQLTCAPSPMHFGATTTGGNETLFVTLNNNQSSSLTITSAASSSPNFTFPGIALPLTIAGGQSATVAINFSPTEVGYTSGTVTFSSNASNPTLRFTVGGTGVTIAAVTANPGIAAFGTVTVGKSSTLPIVLTNKRSFSAVISGIKTNGSGFSVTGPAMPLTLKPGQSITVNATFTPQTTGFTGGDVFVSGSSFSFTVPVTGTGATVTAGSLSISPAPLNFGSVNVGSSATDPITVTASGASVTISSASSTNSSFNLSGATFPLTIAAGQSASLNVVFSPKSSGSASGTLALASNASNSTATESMSGTGTAAATGSLTISPAPLNFGNVNVGSSETEPIVVTASGASVTITSASSSNALFTLSGVTFPVTIPAGQTASLNVAFSPKTSGAASSTLSLISNASNNPTESLSGTGTPNAVTLSWTPSTSSVVGYNIYRGASASGPFSKMNPSVDAVTTYTDTSVMGGNTYYYVATSVNSAGQESSYSSPALQAVVP